MQKVLDTISKIVLYLTLGLYGVFVIINNTSPFVISKEEVLVVGTSLLVLIWVAKMIIKGTLTFHSGKFDLGVLLLALTYLASTFLRTPNKMEAYLLPGTTTFVLAGALLYFLINQFDEKAKKGGLIALFISGMVLSLTSLLSSLNAFSQIPQLPALVKDPSFNLMGGTIPSIVYLLPILAFAFTLLLKEKDTVKKAFYGVCMAAIVFAVLSLVISSLPGKVTSPRFVSTETSWEITVEALKKSPLLGAGPANYLTAFNLFRPVTYNQTDLWQIRFATASNLYFTLITETGFLGLISLVVLLISVYKYVKKDLKFTNTKENIADNLEKLSVVLLVVLFAILPITPAVFAYLLILLGLFSGSEHKSVNMNIVGNHTEATVSTRVPAIIIGIPFVVGVLAVTYFGARVLKAEATFTKSLVALGKNDAQGTYNLMNVAINENPRVDRYHASFAQVNMALANSLAGKKQVTDQDRSNITQLVQQAISEGKATVSLNPQRSANWEILAQIYRSIMPFAQGADQFTVQTYTQAIALDPTNPNLRIALGGTYYSLGNFDAALDSFKLAALAKPDLANAHYNLASAYREKKDYDNAIAEMNNVLKLVKPGSQDETLAKQTLTDIQSKKSAAKTQTGGNTETLTPPTQNEKSNVNPPITLPNEATPPASGQ